MESYDEDIEYFEIGWHIENFHFCWHKTGERLESPLFNINIPNKTSWKLVLYPRGEDDGEYISCYLFREKGGEEIVDVDFELYLHIGETLVRPRTIFSKIYSFKCYQREGLKCFISRQEVFAPIVAQKDGFTLIVYCKMFNPSIECCKQYIFTRIETESMYGTEVFDYDTESDPGMNNVIDVKPMLNDDPLINISLLYIEESLIIKIYPVSCKEIKYATIKISIVKNCGEKSPIDHVRSWIGEIKADTCRYKVQCREEELAKLYNEANTQKTFLLHYNFTFSTGAVVEKYGFGEYISDVVFYKNFNQQGFNSNNKKLLPSGNVLEALGDVYLSKSYSDINIVMKTITFSAHKAIICSRSPELKFLVKRNNAELCLDIFGENDIEDVFRFLYKDIVEFPFWTMAFELYKIAACLEIPLLQTKCRQFLMDNLDQKNAFAIFLLSSIHEDIPMKTFVENYIVSYYDLILSSINLQTTVKCDPKLRKDMLFLKYKKR